MAADNSARAIFIRGLLLLGMMLYLIYSLGFQNTDELKQQITQEVNASRSLISNDRWLSVIANSEATLSTLSLI
ncbi:conjugal transfer protein TraJ, partial [Salmonella enterica subsp. enterica serovar Panama]